MQHPGGSQQQSSMASPGGGEHHDAASLKTLASDFLGLLSEGRAFSDVTFEVEGRQVFAHRCVLAARSPFFRMIFCGDAHLLNSGTAGQVPPVLQRNSTPAPTVIPVGIVGYDVFMLLLQFLYSGTFLFKAQHCGRACTDKSCRHSHCSSAVEFGLEMLNAAVFFGVEQLSTITQKYLGAMAEKASIEDVMRMLARAGKKEDLHLWHLWSLCSKLVAKSGLSVETLQKHLPAEVVLEVETIRHKSENNSHNTSNYHNNYSEQKTKRMQKALDSSDVELVKLMVMGEGLNLDKAFALHYAITSCSRKVVKTLLELGAANVNLRGPDGRAPLHLAAHQGDPEKIAMLLDHRADPHVQAAMGATAMDIVQAGATEALASSSGGYNAKVDHNRLRLCLELLERAVASTAPSVYAKVEISGGGSVLTSEHHGSSTALQVPETESDNFNRSSLLSNSHDDFFASFTSGLSGRVGGRGESVVGGNNSIRDHDTSDSISKLLFSSNSLVGEFDYSEPQLQAESRNYSMLDLEPGERPHKLPRLLADLKDLPMLREVVLKDITNDATDPCFKSLYDTTTNVDEEVSSGWQLLLQEHTDAFA